MKVLLDTNVILDHLLKREPHASYATILFSWVEETKIIGYLCTTTLTTLHYLIYRVRGKAATKPIIASLLKLFEIAPVNRLVLEKSLHEKFSDYEDAVLYESALHIGVDAIVTRDNKGFKSASIPIFTPKEIISTFQKVY